MRQLRETKIEGNDEPRVVSKVEPVFFLEDAVSLVL